MKLKLLLGVLCFWCSATAAIAQTPKFKCLQDLQISLDGAPGVSEIVQCVDDPGLGKLRFRPSSLATPIYYLVTDPENVIVLPSLKPTIDFSALPPGAYRVWALSFVGLDYVKPGLDADTAELASLCYELSDNFISIVRVIPDGKTVATANGDPAPLICTGDGRPNVLGFETTSRDPFYAYAVTDTNNVIVGLAPDGTYDFEDASEGVCRVWGFSYVGAITAQPGQVVTEAVLADKCYDLSDNFVTVTKTVPDGGAVALDDNRTDAVLCAENDDANTLAFSSSSSSLAHFRFLLTDGEDRLLEVLTEGSYDFGRLPAGTYRIRGLSFTGQLIVQTGDNITAASLSDDCFDLSDNAIIVTKKDPIGGEIQLENGESGQRLCVNDGAPDLFSFRTNAAVTEQYIFVLTNADNIIEAFDADGNIDFEGTAGGEVRVWGLAYSGNLTVGPGDDLDAGPLSDECYERSVNFLTFTRIALDGGAVSLEGGEAGSIVCLGDEGADVRTVLSDSDRSTGQYLFVVTDEANRILQFDDDGIIDFGGADPDVRHVWGLNFTGNLLAEAGQDLTTTPLSDDCYQLSANFVTITRKLVDGGTISPADSTRFRLCANDGASDLLSFLTDSESSEAYAFLLTDEDNNIIAVFNEAGIDFEGRPAGMYRVWGLSYTGTLTAQAGQNAATAVLSDQCFELSENFLTLTSVTVDGGTVRLDGGDTETTVCLGDAGADVRTIISTGAGESGRFIFLVTDDSNTILQLDEDGIIDFSGADPGTLRVWGLHYTGNLKAAPGQDAGATPLSDECYDLSDNYVTVTLRLVDGGTLSLEGGATSVRLCANDGAPDPVVVLTSSQSPETYVYLLTDENNNIITVSADATIDFEGRASGIYRIWGLSYTGNLTAQPEQDAATAALSDQCFELSENFLTLTSVTVDGGTVRLDGSDTETTVCLGDAGADVRTIISTGAGESGRFIFLITDDSNTILQLDEDGIIDFSGADPGALRVWGLHYTGNLTAAPGQDAGATPLSDECYDLSDNYVTVTLRLVDGGTLSLEGGATSVRLCANDGAPDPVAVLTSSQSPETYAYLLTDENNSIIAVSTDATIDFEGRPAGIYRLWGLSYTGNLTAAAGQDAGAGSLSDQCFELSENFLTITTLTVDGGAVSLADGTTETNLCIGDAGSDVLTVISSGAGEGGSFVFLVTDDNNTIVRLEENGAIDFGGTASGTLRVWGLQYTGNLLAEPGQNALTSALSDECFSLSGNFVQVVRRFVDGGFVALNTGATQGLACVGDGRPDLFEFVHQTGSDAAYTYVVTDDNDRILLILTGNRINFDVAPAGVCRVYGLSYTGRLTSRVNVDVQSIALSDQCYELSENFVVITKEEVTGGLISLAGGANERYTCPDDGRPDPITVSTTGGGTGQYVYLVTNGQDSIVRVSANPVIDFEGTPAGIYRIRGLAYSGTLLAGTTALTLGDPLSGGCYQLSGNALTIIHEAPVGGSVALDDGTTERLSCPTAANPPVLTFDSTGVSGPAFTYLITSESDEIQALVEGDQFDFANLPAGAYRVWGLAYSGQLTAEVGDIAGIDDLSDICYSLSGNFILVINREPEGGTVATEEGETTTYTAPGDGIASIVRVDSAGTVGRYVYLFTDVNNLIRAVLPADSIDMDTVAPGRYRIYGLAYIGQLLAAPGQNAVTATLADECFDLSANFVTINNAVPEAGTIATSENETELSFCVGDGQTDLAQFVATDASPSRYAYLLTRDDNTLIGIIPGDRIDFDTTGGGAARVWGVAYTGRLIIGAGEDVTTAPLSSDNFDLSDNFITVNRTGVDGGPITSSIGDGTIYVCRGDGVADPIQFSNTGREPGATYRYVLTNESNRILAFLEGNQQDFENLGLARLRVWGISFTGDLLARSGQTLTQTPISNGCYTLSQNFITVVSGLPDGGRLSTTTNETEVLLCVGVRDPQLSFRTTSQAITGFRYLLTDTNNVVLQVLTTGTIDFGAFPNGAYHVWGLSYTGRLLVEPGQDLDLIVPAGSCYDLTDNFVPVRRSGPVEGGVVTTNTGSDVFTVCPRNGVADILILRNTSTSTADSYRYVITDTRNRIVIPDIEGNVIDFDGADPGVYRVWGVSYTGTFLAGFGMDVQTARLASECYQASSTFVTVTSQGPTGGQISTTDGRTGAFSTAACGGDAPDVLSFTNNGTATGAASYHFLISREDTILAVVTPGQSFDFSTLSCESAFRVTGLAYTAATLPNIVGATLPGLRAGLVLTECFDLSDNQLSVTQGNGIQGNPSPQVRVQPGDQLSFGEGFRDLQVAPNPAVDRLQIRFQSPDQPAGESELWLFNAAGQWMRRLTVATQLGFNQLELSIDDLPRGVYIIRLRNGQWQEQTRFVKGE